MAIIQLTSDNFEAEVLNSDKPVLVDFYADWCGPCKMMAPVVDQIAEENDDIKVGKINVDDEQDLAAKYGVMSIPTIGFFKGGDIVDKSVGAKPKSELLKMIGK
ncbi:MULTISPECIES: thioredoxin [Butyrivibrio]|jgi:thioredoxin 1|uniref:Thioredoxin n=1 Tax=Butyrivibrio fibrisolvens TaxID=831 RepID=A0A1H9UXK6_BUTFI|nr:MULTISPECIES: thioredoxin [Butyrivibrio]MBQ1457873.1 thioredoxin [Butyrivibrio sp.]MCR4634623.1 thioredoxin [Butyrivibrio sp.]PWT28659.1 thioredoxin [Butyrivibrio fibrisolvens]SEP82025.1 thioredoxin [Butyrivibrio sp. TB]SES13743.1 thioredoxin [Butyrivibrio fibrisolvens]